MKRREFAVFITPSIVMMVLLMVIPLVLCIIFRWLFRDYWGFYSYLLSKVGINIAWYGTPWAARFLLIIYEVWQNTPFVIIVLFAGLQAMPSEPLEAAYVDGASGFQRLVYIIIPLLQPLFIFIALMRTMDAYRVFDSAFVMTGGGPGSATELVTFYNYIVSFKQLKLGLGSAISVLTVIGIVILLSPFLYLTYKRQLEVE